MLLFSQCVYQLSMHVFYLVIDIHNYPKSEHINDRKTKLYYDLRLYNVVIGLIISGIVTNLICTMFMLVLRNLINKITKLSKLYKSLCY